MLDNNDFAWGFEQDRAALVAESFASAGSGRGGGLMPETEKGRKPLLERVADAVHARRVYESEQALVPDELQVTAARDLERLLGEPVDPLDVVLCGYSEGYDRISFGFHGVRITGSYKWGGRDWRYSLCGRFDAARTVSRRWRSPLVETRELYGLADLDGWFEVVGS